MRLPIRPTLGSRWRRFVGVKIRRTTGGVVEIRGDDDLALARGLGFAHAHDRQVQMMLVRLIGEGRLCECLKPSDEALATDVFMRQMGFAEQARQDAERCSPEAAQFGEAYCDGVNAYLRRYRPRAEWLALGYEPAPWQLSDILLTVGVMSYVGLAQSQQDMEKLIIQSIAEGVDVDMLKSLLAPHLDELDESMIEVLREVQIHEGLLPDAVRFAAGLPKIMASNNWALAGSRSATGSAVQCNDPHLEVNRLPAIWYEWVGRLPDGDYRMGVSMPGTPGTIMGRNRHVSAGFTYGFMDLVDYFVEEVREGKVRRGADWVPIERRSEEIHKKGEASETIEVRRTDRGVLEVDPRAPVPDGYVLCRAWSGELGAAPASLDALLRVGRATNVDQAARAAREVSISCNWLLADRDGRIAYQQSGALPRRAHSGLHPVPAWDDAYAWRGRVEPAALVHFVDPEDGILVTANQLIEKEGCPLAINMPMGSYRADRIRQVLEAEGKHDLDAMRSLQGDLYSIQAEQFLAWWKPLLPDTEAGAALRRWDRRYDARSKGAPLFEDAYAALLREVFGKRLFGLPAWDALCRASGILADFYGVFDEVLLGRDDPRWFGDEGREALTKRVLAEALAASRGGTWGERRQVTMAHILFGEKLPEALGFDFGPIALEGGRATPVQGAVYQAHGRTTTFAPSWRYITDLGRDEVHTALAGGPSGRRTSKHYVSDLQRWLSGGYKTLG